MKERNKIGMFIFQKSMAKSERFAETFQQT